MATIRIRKNDLFHAGLVSVSEELLVIIVEEAKKILNKSISKITKRFLYSTINEFCASNYHERIIGAKSTQLSLFISDICWKERETAVARITLSLPILATVRDHSGIWRMIKNKIGIPGFVSNGELCLDIELKDENCPIEKNIESGKKVFIIHPKESPRESEVAA